MNRDETREAIEVMQAFVDGAEIERTSRSASKDWFSMTSIVWDWYTYQYRIKKTPRTFWVRVKDDVALSVHQIENGVLLEKAECIKVQEVIE